MAETVLSPDDLASQNCGYWMLHRQMALPNGQPFSFVNHEYQMEWYDSKARRRCYMKATGGGVSECEIWKTLHGMVHKRLPQGAAYWFPDNDAMEDFSNTRVGPLFDLNPDTLGKYVSGAPQGRKKKSGADNVKVKRIGNANFYLRGARLQQKGDTDTRLSSKTSGIQVDKNVFDEVDQFDQNVLAKICARMGHSAVQEEVYIANPSDEDYGIDLIWQQCDQRHWFRKCCNEWSCPEEDFPDIYIKYDADGRSYIACKKCGKPLPVFNGEGTGQYVPKYPSNSKYVGWRWSHLSSIFHQPAEIMEKFTNPPQGNLGDVYRLDLGLPYSSKEDKLRREDVLACCGHNAQALSHPGPCAMGVDNDMKKHIVIGTRTGSGRFEIVRVCTVEGFDAVFDLAQKYNVRSTVVDRKPNIDAAVQFMKNSQHNKVFLCDYSDTLAVDTIWNNNTRIVKVNRTACFDASHRTIIKGDVVIPRQSPAIEEFARQCCNVARFKEKNKRTGQEVYRYRTTGSDKADHDRNALNYFLLAASKVSAVSKSSYGRRLQTKAVHETVPI